MQRGDVYRFKVPKGVGNEQQGERFGVGRLTAEEMWSIDEALVVVLGLE